MRLERPFSRLPLRFDAERLADEAASLPASAWRPHPEGLAGNTAVPLVAVGGLPANDSTRGAMAPTPHLAHCPYLQQVLASFQTVIGRTRLMRIEGEGEVRRHVDTNYYWWEHLRLHIPVRTTPDVTFECGPEAVHMAAGEAWVFDTWRQHRVRNLATTDRIHLVIDTVGSATLWDMIDIDGEAAPDATLAPGAGRAELLFERVNHPTVMTPSEVVGNLQALSREAAAHGADGGVDLIDRQLRRFRHQWSAAWAAFGESPDGWATFEGIRAAADAAIDDHADRWRLSNGIDLVEAI
ncbi:MAG: aspartyl/asparaginyl beta-hydroxylase domain-containing protein, partial [Acidimicrobiales bacterium]